MKKLGLNEIRERYLRFFEGKGHERMLSHSLVPENDKSLLLINSGMAPLKPYFTGQETPPNKRATTCQKCIRTGDIENVGKTARHGTFFEMLGNFSFGDYFKKEMIPWAWEFMTKELEIPEERLFVSVYQDDDEAADIWHNAVGLPKEKIFRMGKDDNFWEVGLGPCGPCSEIYIDRGERFGCGKPGCAVGCDCDRYMEVWNLVFTQFNKEENGSYSNLPNPNIDTGMGLERIASVLQDAESIFDVDTLTAVRDKVCALADVSYHINEKRDISIRVITDHARAITFMAADGILPANDGRGYVMKRLLRRAARHGKLLGLADPFLTEVCKVVVEVSKGAYPELVEKQDYLFKVIGLEESRFYETLDQGIELLKKLVSKIKEARAQTLSGQDAFKLYDTFGFPLDLVKEMLEEDGILVDEEAFRAEMEGQRNRARNARGDTTFMGADETVYHQIASDMTTEFVGYDTLVTENAAIIALVANGQLAKRAEVGAKVSVLLDKTAFYAESGGQTGDKGKIVTQNGVVAVTDCVKVVGGRFAHLGVVESGIIDERDTARAEVDEVNRLMTARNHSATHLLHKALKQVLGSHVEQAGSLVTPGKLRFDFSHFQAVTKEEVRAVEDLVNEQVLAALPVDVRVMSMEEARAEGAVALFGEKYGDSVRVVSMGGYSVELCGGTHVRNTAQVGLFKILSESSAAAGIRRVEALTGTNAIAFFRQMEDNIQRVAALMKGSPETLLRLVEQALANDREMRRELESLKAKLSGSVADDLAGQAETVGDLKVLAGQAPGLAQDALKNMGDQLKDKLRSGVVILLSAVDDKATMLVMVTDDAVAKGVKAGDIVKEAIAVLEGKGGGKPTMAMAGGKNNGRLEEALQAAKAVVAKQLGL